MSLLMPLLFRPIDATSVALFHIFVSLLNRLLNRIEMYFKREIIYELKTLNKY